MEKILISGSGHEKPKEGEREGGKGGEEQRKGAKHHLLFVGPRQMFPKPHFPHDSQQKLLV